MFRGGYFKNKSINLVFFDQLSVADIITCLQAFFRWKLKTCLNYPTTLICKGYLPNSRRTPIFVVCFPTPRIFLKNLIWTFSRGLLAGCYLASKKSLLSSKIGLTNKINEVKMKHIFENNDLIDLWYESSTLI